MKARHAHEIDALLRSQMCSGQVTGLAVMVVQDYVRVYDRGFSTLPGRREAVTGQTRFPLCSVSKTLTATAILHLVERGVLDLDCPVLRYLDGRLPAQHGLTEDVTLRRLLSHTAGFTRWHAPPAAPPATALSEHIWQVLPGHPRLAPPGRLHDYSNFGINLAGYIAEVAAGKPFARLLHDVLFEPLDMRQTTFERDQGPSFPAGSAVSTTEDLAHFARMLMDEGCYRGRRLLTTASLEAMWAPHARLYMPDEAARGLAFRLDTYKGIRRFGHAGRGGTFSSRLRIAPDADLVVILLAQGSDLLVMDRTLTAIEQRLFDVLLDLPATQPPPRFLPPNPARWPRYTGSYVGPEQGLARIEAAAGLFLNWKGRQTALLALQEDLYVGTSPDGPAVGFVPERTAPPTMPVPYLMLEGRPLQRTKCSENGAPGPATWNVFVGRYLHPSLSGAQVFVRNERLCISFDWLGGWLSCEPLGPRHFACRLGLIEFQEANDGISAFTFRRACIFKRCL